MAVDLSDIGSIFPTKESIIPGVSSTFFWITLLIIIFFFLIIGGVGIILLIRYLQFNKKIQIWEERNNQMEYIGKDRAKEIKYNIYGDTVFVLKKRKKFLPRGEIKSGRNVYLYCIREDGEWVNFSLESVNQKLKDAGVKFIHPDMRAFKSGTAKIIKDSYQKKSFLKEWAPIIVPIIFFVIVGIALYFVVDRIVASENNLLEMTKASKEVMQLAKEVLTAVNNIKSGSGYAPAG